MNRREFLKAGVVGAIGLAAGKLLPKEKTTSPNKQIGRMVFGNWQNHRQENFGDIRIEYGNEIIDGRNIVEVKFLKSFNNVPIIAIAPIYPQIGYFEDAYISNQNSSGFTVKILKPQCDGIYWTATGV